MLEKFVRGTVGGKKSRRFIDQRTVALIRRDTGLCSSRRDPQ